MNPALDGITVIDLSQVAAVPMCARHLADFGANVIHLENPGNGDFWRAFQEIQAKAMAGVPMEINHEEWIPRLERLPYAPVQTVKEAVKDFQSRAAGCFIDYDHPQSGQVENLASPVNISQTPASYRMPAPELEQHTEEVLLESGYTREDISRLEDQGIIG